MDEEEPDPLLSDSGAGAENVWIRATSKKRRFRKLNGESDHGMPTAAPTPLPGTRTSSISALQIRDEYLRVQSEWQESPSCSRLVNLVRRVAGTSCPVRQAVCLGIGTFDPESGSWEVKRRAYVELAAFVTIVDCLC